MRTSWMWVLAGCPYVFGPPDLSGVGGADTPGTDGGDTDTDVGTDTDGGTDTEVPPAGAPPVVVSFEVVPRMTEIVIHFAIADTDSELVGSALSLSDGTNQWTVAIPGGVDLWEPDGISTVALPLAPIPGTGSWLDCETPIHQLWSVVPVDIEGNVGAAVEAPLDIAALGVLPEVGGNVWPQDQHVTEAAPPFMGCVTYELPEGGGGDPNVALSEDFEGIGFTSLSAESYVAQLRWDVGNPADIDLYVYWYPTVDANPYDGIADVAASSTAGGPAAEQVTWTAGTEQGWLVDFPFFGVLPGGEPPFRSHFLIAPR